MVTLAKRLLLPDDPFCEEFSAPADPPAPTVIVYGVLVSAANCGSGVLNSG